MSVVLSLIEQLIVVVLDFQHTVFILLYTVHFFGINVCVEGFTWPLIAV